jgi:hypothetical protein
VLVGLVMHAHVARGVRPGNEAVSPHP